MSYAILRNPSFTSAIWILSFHAAERRRYPGVMNLAARASSITVTRIMREHCSDCFFGNEEDSRGLCFLYPDNPVEVNYSDPVCENFELSE